MTLTRLAPIAGETILPLVAAKAQIRVLHTDEDALISALRDAAALHIERISGVALALASFRWTGETFPGIADLPMRPVVAVTEVAYHDEDGEAATYTGARLVNGMVFPAVAESWPYANGYASITFTAGETAPADLLAAVRLMVGHLYANREAGAEKVISGIPMGVDALVQSYRRVMV